MSVRGRTFRLVRNEQYSVRIHGVKDIPTSVGHTLWSICGVYRGCRMAYVREYIYRSICVDE